MVFKSAEIDGQKNSWKLASRKWYCRWMEWLLLFTISIVYFALYEYLSGGGG